jgi:hypothetical protein
MLSDDSAMMMMNVDMNSDQIALNMMSIIENEAAA